MDSHPKGGADGARKRKRDVDEDFSGLNPELPAANGDDAAGRRAAKAQDDAEGTTSNGFHGMKGAMRR